MIRGLYDKFADKFRWVHCYASEQEAQADADLMNSWATMFHYTVVKGRFWFHVLATSTDDNKPFGYL